jgi:GxxExxY protein
MAIDCPISIRTLSKSEFADLDYRVMRLAFESQNTLGRLCDEIIYQNDLAIRLESAGLGPIYKEVPVTVTHREFKKTYWLDLVVSGAAVYELKTVTTLSTDHEAQLLNYLFLSNCERGKLINFRPAQVQSRFVNAALTTRMRRQFEIDTRLWHDSSEPCKFFEALVLEMLEDWGTSLELSLYTEALTFLFGGEERVLQPVPLIRNGQSMGHQRLHLLSPDVAFRYGFARKPEDL